MLIAVALLPLGVPLLWLTASLLAGKQPVFSFVAPVAMALGAGGLCAGIASVHIWGFAARIRAMLAVVVLGYWLTIAFGVPMQHRLWGAMYPANERGHLLGIVEAHDIRQRKVYRDLLARARAGSWGAAGIWCGRKAALYYSH